MIPSTGPLSLLDLQNEYGGSDTISLTEYYRNYYLYPTPVLDIAYNAGIPQKTTPNNPTISLSHFRGKEKVSYKVRTWSFADSGYWYVPSDYRETFMLTVWVVGGGGQGAGWPSGAEGGGGGEGARVSAYRYPLVAGSSHQVIIGAGGTGGARVETGAYGGDSSFGNAGSDLYIYARGGIGGIASGGAAAKQHSYRDTTSANDVTKNYWIGGGTTGRNGAVRHSLMGGGSGASNCNGQVDDRSGVTAGGASTYVPIIFSYGSEYLTENNTGASSVNYMYGRGGYGCGGGDKRIANQGSWPGGGGGGADYNATGGNGAKGGVFVTLKYWGV